MRHLKIGYADIMRMPTGERRFYLSMFEKEVKKQKDHFDEIKKNRHSNAKGSRSRTISGEELKQKLKTGQIPNT